MNSTYPVRTTVFALIVLLGLIVSDLPASKKWTAHDDSRVIAPLTLGEALNYDIRWGIIRAGSGTLSISESTSGDGVYHIVNTARSNAIIDKFYKVRNRIETFFDVEKSSSVGYRKVQREGSHRRDVDLVFDHDQSAATLFRNGKKRRTIAVPASIHDPLSAIYYLRTVPSFEDRPVVLNVTDGKKNFQVQVVVHGRETVETPLGFFDTIKIEPVVQDMELIFEKKKGGKLYIWLSDDDRKLPVQMQSELYFGSIQVVLTGIDRLS
ncbi:MAG: DUF3108 domain-containing protein [bacterium]|nr:DUF3108 domain-containing protein [bacterium]